MTIFRPRRADNRVIGLLRDIMNWLMHLLVKNAVWHGLGAPEATVAAHAIELPCRHALTPARRVSMIRRFMTCIDRA